MSEQVFSKDNLVLYKSNPAKVIAVTDSKIEITLENGKNVKVRSKDIELLHEGPLKNFSELKNISCDIEETHELLQGEAVSFDELVELLFSECTPSTALCTYRILEDGLYFSGSIQDIQVCSTEEVTTELQKRNAKENEQKEWEALIERIRTKKIDKDDISRLREVEQVAYGKATGSKILKELSIEITRENAHNLLLQLGVWDERVNPYPQRMGVETNLEYPPVPQLPEEDRLDLTHLPAFAIDDEGNKDPDDALSIDGDRLWIHIADVAALVKPDSDLDLLAKSQGANSYLPEKTVTMLPPETTEVLGLGLQEISPAFSFGITLNDDGSIDDIQIRLTKVKVTRTTYKDAESQIGVSPFKEMHEFTQKFRAYRERNKAIFLNFPEVKFHVENDEIIFKQIIRYDSSEMVADAMMMAGEAAALFAEKNNIAIPYTAQLPPEEERSPQTLSEMFAYRKFLQPSQITSSPGGHAGLGLARYCRATSPLRRYVDLVVHQQLRAFITGGTPLDEDTILDRIGSYNAIARDVQRLERFSNKHWTLVHLQRNPQWTGKAIVVEERERGYTAIIPEFALETRLNGSTPLELDQEITLAVSDIQLAGLNEYFKVVV